MQSIFTLVEDEFLHPLRKIIHTSPEMTPKNPPIIPTSHRGVFRTQSNIYDGAFVEIVND